MTTEMSVLYFAKSAELTGHKSETIRVLSELMNLELWEDLVNRHPRLFAVHHSFVLAVRQEYVTLGDQRKSLRDGGEVAVIPPLRGGGINRPLNSEMSEEGGRGPRDLVKVTHDKLSVDAVSDSSPAPPVVLFPSS
ncbi:molybdopterin synthase sulfur carrier subunit isoform X3 [Salvelinus alpinus]|uniref:molybdopterin synthase sulfur carrier subunit isoform X3 n=1 Tax=Salvelinus alpinus TaxID=8036 RepID=UPI0039FD8AB4